MLCNHALASCCINEMTNFRGEKREPFLGNDKRLVNKERGEKKPQQNQNQKENQNKPKSQMWEFRNIFPSAITHSFRICSWTFEWLSFTHTDAHRSQILSFRALVLTKTANFKHRVHTSSWKRKMSVFSDSLARDLQQ